MLDKCLPESRGSLIIVEGILVHAQQFVSLTETIPCSVIFPVDIYKALRFFSVFIFNAIVTHRPHVDMPLLPRASSSFQRTRDP